MESVAWSPDGKRILTGSVDSTAKVWDATGDRGLRTLEMHGARYDFVYLDPPYELSVDAWLAALPPLAGGHTVVLLGAKDPEHPALRRTAVNVPGHGRSVLFHLLGGEARVAAVDQKTFAPADAGQHPADEVGVVAVVVVGVGVTVAVVDGVGVGVTCAVTEGVGVFVGVTVGVGVGVAVAFTGGKAPWSNLLIEFAKAGAVE